MNATCQKCGTGHPADARFCPGCGANLAGSQNKTRVSAGPSLPTLLPMVAARTNLMPARTTSGQSLAPVSDLPEPREDLIIITDVSDSMKSPYSSHYTKLEAAYRAAISLVLEKVRIRPQDAVGLVAFNAQAWPVLPILPVLSHKPQILQAIQSLRPGGDTNINEGLKAAQNLFDWNGEVLRRVTLLTDGCGGHPLHTAEQMKSRGVVIDVIGVGKDPSGVNEGLLKAVASVVQGELRYRFIRDHQTLVTHFTTLAGKTAVGA